MKKNVEEHDGSHNINKTIEFHRDALNHLASSHQNRGELCFNLAAALYNRFGQQGNLKDIAEAIELFRELLILHPADVGCLNDLASALLKRFEQHGDSKDLEKATELYREALALSAPPHPDHDLSLNNLATTLHRRFMQQGDSEDLDEAIKLHMEVLTLRAPPHPARGSSLNNLAAAFLTRFEQQGDLKDIDEAIQLLRECLALRAQSHPARGGSLNNLATAVRSRFDQLGDPKDISEAIELYRVALTLHASPHPGRSSSLNNLAMAVTRKFGQQGDLNDIDEAIELYREALDLRAQSHPARGDSLNNLAAAIRARFEQRGDLKDINEAIQLHREALALAAPPHPSYGMCLNNLAAAVQTRFEHQGDLKDIDESIKLYRERLAVLDSRHPDRGGSLTGLAAALQTRFEHRGDIRDLDEATGLNREALVLHGLPHPARGKFLDNLGASLHRRFIQRRDSRDINQAIELHREAVALHAQPHLARGSSLDRLAIALQTRFGHEGNSQDIDEAIELHREVLALRVPPHPDRSSSLNNLAAAVQNRFEQQRDLKDIDMAIQLHREVLALRTPPHPARGHSLNSLGVCLTTLYVHSKDDDDLDQALALFQEATTYSSSSPLTRFLQACSWARTAATYTHTLTSALAGYHAAIELLPQLVALHMDLSSRQQILSTAGGAMLASAAATCAVELEQYNIAVEFLEASRSVFWSQALHLRTPLDDLATTRPDLSGKLTGLSRQLEQASFRDTSRNPLTDTQHKMLSIESESAHSRQLNKEWEKAIKDVQELPGFEGFMRPKRISDLKQAAVSGPIIILITTNSTYSALIITLTNEVQCLKLPDLILPILATLDARLFGSREGIIKRSSDDVFRGLLADLWKSIVKPVLKALNFKASKPFSRSVHPPRLWWCPTGPLSFLPIHAAGIYGKDITDCTSDYVISSYTPTLTALLDPPVHTTAAFKITAVIQPSAPNCSPLPGATRELNKIVTWVPNQWLTTLVNGTVESAQIHLPGSSIVHFACHGVQDKEPLNSGLILTDGSLRISDIMHRPEEDHALEMKKSMSLAFLSACETAMGDKTRPDEAMHLAATLLFAGFRGVVGTMWTMDDLDGPRIADTFYKHLFKDCDPNSNPPIFPDLTCTAEALHLAVAKLREEPDILFRRWVPFVHYGL
ncbi:CHAT domain-containing protein [Mycena vulgaris]|nr:CHAT domain-containing protein [Mycena vulgaris]